MPPNMGPQNYVTYEITSKLAPTDCASVGCPAWVSGWVTTVDEKTELGQRQAHYIRKESGRGYKEYRNEEGLTEFEFFPGQHCFGGDHKIPVPEGERFFRKGGDWRGDPRREGRYEHTRPDNWVEDFAEHQEKIKTALERG